MNTPAPTHQPSVDELALIDETVGLLADVERDVADSMESRLLTAGRMFIEPGHPSFDYYRWRLGLEIQAPPAKKTGHVTVTMNDDFDSNTPVSMGQLVTMLAPLIETGNHKPGIFLDSHGHVVLPASAFDEATDDQNATMY